MTNPMTDISKPFPVLMETYLPCPNACEDDSYKKFTMD